MNRSHRIPFAAALVPAALAVHLALAACSGAGGSEGTAQAGPGAGGASTTGPGSGAGAGGMPECACRAMGPTVVEVPCVNTSGQAGRATLLMSGRSIDEMARVQALAQFIVPRQIDGVLYAYEPPSILIDEGRATVDCAKQSGTPALIYSTVRFVIPQ